MRLKHLDKIKFLLLMSFTMFILLCYHCISSNAQWETYPYTSISQQQWGFTADTLQNLQQLISYPAVPGSFNNLWANLRIKASGSYDSFLTQGLGLSCFLIPSGTGVPYCPGVSVKVKVYWRDPGGKLRNAIQWYGYGMPLPYGSEYTIYPIFPRGRTDTKSIY